MRNAWKRDVVDAIENPRHWVAIDGIDWNREAARIAKLDCLYTTASQLSGVGSGKSTQLLLSDDYPLASMDAGISISGLQWTGLSLPTRTAYFCVQQWMFVREALYDHQANASTRALEAIVPPIAGWCRTHLSAKSVNDDETLAWHDHATALRAINALRYVGMLPLCGRDVEAGLPNPAGFFAAHLAALAAESFYQKHTNHGLDQSIALYILSRALRLAPAAEPTRALSRERMLDEVSFALTPDGVHVENSPGYHAVIVNRLTGVIELLEAFGEADGGDEIRERINRALGFLTAVIRPDGSLPKLGDTDPSSLPQELKKLANLENYPAYLYSWSRGKRGRKPSEPDSLFPIAGYAFFRDRWRDAGDFGETAYVAVKCGFLSRYHRHDDDNTVLFSARGEPWLIDGGIYAYRETDPRRIYLRSARSHNVALIEGVEASRKIPPEGKTRICDWQSEAGFARVRAVSVMYDGFVYERELVFERETAAMTVADTVTPGHPSERHYQLRWHFPGDKTVTIESPAEIRVASEATGHELRITVEAGRFEEAYVLTATDEPEVAGWMSERMGSLTPAHTLILRSGLLPRLDSRCRFAFVA